jgi:glutamate-1-semialdehyde 2,1-aminomutase
MRFQRKPRSEREAAYLERCAEYLPVGVRNASYNPDYMMVIAEARGSRITDCSGNEYIDYLLGSGPMFLGHAHPAVLKAVEEQLQHGTSYLMVSEPAIDLAEEIVNAVPCAEQVSFHNSGSEATFFALRVARAYRKRDKILKFEGGYHGMGDSALMSTQWTQQPMSFPSAHADSSGIPESVRDETLIAPYNDFETASAIIEKHADELACVIVEPLHRTIPPRDGFLQELRKLTAHLEIPLIVEEVVTGFRLALGGAQELYGVTPDLCALGKTISGGHPFGVLCGKSEIMSMASPARIMTGDWARLSGTFSSNPISCRAALAIIEELKKPGFYEAVERKGNKLRAGLVSALASAGIDAQVSGEATVFQPWFINEPVVDHRTSLGADARMNLKFIDRLLDRGIVKGHEKFFVSAAHSDEDIDDTIEAIETATEEMARS